MHTCASPATHPCTHIKGVLLAILITLCCWLSWETGSKAPPLSRQPIPHMTKPSQVLRSKLPPPQTSTQRDFGIHAELCWWHLAVDGVFDADRHPIEQTLPLHQLGFADLVLAFLQKLRDAVGFCGKLEGLGESRTSPQVSHSPWRCTMTSVLQRIPASSPFSSSPSAQLLSEQPCLLLFKPSSKMDTVGPQFQLVCDEGRHSAQVTTTDCSIV